MASSHKTFRIPEDLVCDLPRACPPNLPIVLPERTNRQPATPRILQALDLVIVREPGKTIWIGIYMTSEISPAIPPEDGHLQSVLVPGKGIFKRVAGKHVLTLLEGVDFVTASEVNKKDFDVGGATAVLKEIATRVHLFLYDHEIKLCGIPEIYIPHTLQVLAQIPVYMLQLRSTGAHTMEPPLNLDVKKLNPPAKSVQSAERVVPATEQKAAIPPPVPAVVKPPQKKSVGPTETHASTKDTSSKLKRSVTPKDGAQTTQSQPKSVAPVVSVGPTETHASAKDTSSKLKRSVTPKESAQTTQSQPKSVAPVVSVGPTETHASTKDTSSELKRSVTPKESVQTTQSQPKSVAPVVSVGPTETHASTKDTSSELKRSVTPKESAQTTQSQPKSVAPVVHTEAKKRYVVLVGTGGPSLKKHKKTESKTKTQMAKE